MKITSRIIRGITGDLIVTSVDGRTINVIIRKGATLRDVADLGDIESEVDVHFALVDDATKAARLIAEPLLRARSGDLVILLCPNNETRRAAFTALGLKKRPARKGDGL